MGVEFKDRLRNELAGAGMSQPFFARKLDVTQQTVTGWVMGRWEPRMKQLAEMAQVLDCSMEYLSGVTDERVTLTEVMAIAEKRKRKRGA